MSFKKILDKYRKISFSQRDKGDRFERLMQAYLQTDPKYASVFKNVWMWNEFPGKLDLGGGDTGIDLVALTYDGDYWAIQCKCYQESSVMDKPAVDSFLSTSSREFKNEQMQTTRFAQRLWISTTNRWGSNATEAIRNQNPPVSRINLHDLIEAPVDWNKLEDGVHGEFARKPKKTLDDPRYAHQKEAMDRTHDHFKNEDRGKLIMACGTGKTFTSLRIAENETNNKGLILFLVPSIALLGQTLREWSADATEPINAIAICSDPDITKQKQKNPDADTFSIVDLAYPASTDSKFILHQFEQIKRKSKTGMTVVFSTYQSIDVIAKAQKELLKNGFPEFDLIICDEAHRTTGVSLAGEDESAFTKVHDAEFIKSKKRLYMTATPRLYDDNTKSKAAEADAILCSMDDDELYGDEIYRIGFGEAVERDLLTDYKVLILTLNDKDVPPAVQKMIADGEHEINTDDVSKIIGTINALSKQFLGDEGITKQSDPEPMKRAVAFCSNIATSKKISATYNTANDAYLVQLPPEKKKLMVSTEAKHMDGTMGAPERDQMLSWLKEDTPENECRIITNVRVLSEGVDVPSLDSVLFLSARNSQVDVVQSVGRVMRRSPGKKYGYIVIPVVVPADVEADKALDDNERYKVVWTVLNALRAHDDRFNATVNKIELNRKKPNNILVGRPEYSFDEDGNPQPWKPDDRNVETPKDIARQLAMQFEELQSVVFARMVKKVGDRRYWEDWAAEVAQIAERQIERINYLIENRTEQRQAFDNFINGLRKNINPSISEAQAVEMLAQHIITKPIFEALFEGYSFTETNAVSIAMQTMLNALQEKTLAEESDKLQKFYDSVSRNITDLDNANAKQKVIIRIYDNFFKTAFPKMVEQLGIVYTPVEVVDFIIYSVNDILKKEFGRSISDENINILDPFTGTGTFITRLLQSGLIDKADLDRKYNKELFANEIVLLAYYIAAVNIENAYHDQIGIDSEYKAFEGIVLTDTFQLGETESSEKLFSEMFPQNSERVQRQKKAPLRVIMGNPPYSVGQKSANDNAQNQSYDKLDSRIADTYVRLTNATNKNSLYDSYIKAFRWATDRLDPNHGGIIAFVTNGAWLDGNSSEGFRKSIESEFSSIWVLNTRGNARTQGELRRKEAGNVFGGGTRTPITITLLVKNPKYQKDRATIHYYDIGDYLNKDEKLSKIKKFKSVGNDEIKWRTLKPNEHGDWINLRNDLFENFISIGDKKDKSNKNFVFLPKYTNGIKTNRDAWVINYASSIVSKNAKRTIDFYNLTRKEYQIAKKNQPKLKVEDFISDDSTKISWSRALRNNITMDVEYTFSDNHLRKTHYRPFTKQILYYNRDIVNDIALMNYSFPDNTINNLLICLPGTGDNKPFSTLMTSDIPDLGLLSACQCFPLHYFEKRKKHAPSLFDNMEDTEYVVKDGVSDFIYDLSKKVYGKNITKEDIFFYVYGILHSKYYRLIFTNDLKKVAPRIPLLEDVRDFWKFSKAGRQLSELHVNYEEVEPYKEVEVTGVDSNNFKVQKMRFLRKGQTDTIVYNSNIMISKIPEKAYQYVVNGKSAIEWIMERYQVKIDKKSGIKNDPNDWCKEVENPRYILDLLLSVINVSVQTVDIVNNLPDLDGKL